MYRRCSSGPRPISSIRPGTSSAGMRKRRPLISSDVAPTIRSTSPPTPLRTAASGALVTRSPSTKGLNCGAPRSNDCGMPSAAWASMSSFGVKRASSSRVAFTPRCWATCLPRSRAVSAVIAASPTPLWQIARRNNPFARCVVSKYTQAAEPADCPAMVTFEGSPPKFAIGEYCAPCSSAD